MKLFNYLLTALLALNLVQVSAQCNAAGSHYTTTASGWSPLFDQGDGVGTLSTACNDGRNGTIYYSGAAVHFNTARGAKEMRLSRSIPVLSNQNWTMDFTLNITAPPQTGTLANNSPSITLASLTADKAGIVAGCPTFDNDFCESCGTYPNTNMDAMWVSLTSNIPNGCTDTQTDKNWRIIAYARDGSGTPVSSTPINITSGANATYYIRLMRTSSGTAMVSVCNNSNYTGHLIGSPQCFNIPGLVTGLDCLNHEVHAHGGCWRVFNGNVAQMKIDNSVICQFTPAFTAQTTVCAGQAITVNAAANSGLPITSHNWGLQECDAAGTVTGPIWWSAAIAGVPATYYTIPSSTPGLTISCGKYYKIFLKAENCSQSTTVSQVLFIGCPPSIRVSDETYVCSGESTDLSVGIRSSAAGTTILWEAISPEYEMISYGSSTGITVAPTVTTQYQVTVYDNTSGCPSTGLITVWVVEHDPTFSISNTLNTNYYTISATPTDLYANFQPGFQYGWTIEELNGSTPYYWNSSMGGTTCWWNYPTPETFLGFVSTGLGTYTQAPGPSCGSAPGQFLYNHTYRITRLVVNEYCPARQYSTIITTTKSGEVIVYEDLKAPDMTHMLGQELPATDNITIFPNPSTGIFTIELEEGTDGAMIEVTNALGQQVKSFEATGLRSEIDMTGFAKGIYVVTIVSNGSTTTKKIILE